AGQEGERVQAAPPAPRVRGRAVGAPAAPEEAAAQELRTPDSRPHAAPWELPERGAPSETAERAAAEETAESGAGRTAAEPAPAADGPDGAEGHDSAGKQRLEALDRHLAQVDTPAPPAPRFAEADDPAAARRRSSGWFTDVRPSQEKAAEKPEAPQQAERAEQPREEKRAEKKAKPGLQLDHGTGDQESFAATLPAPADRKPAAERKAAERKAECKSEYELDHGTGEHESFADTSAPDDAPERPAARAEAAGAAPGSTLPREQEKQEKERPAAPAEPAPAKSEYELDHGTGEHESFASSLPGTGADAPAGSENGSGGARQERPEESRAPSAAPYKVTEPWSPMTSSAAATGTDPSAHRGDVQRRTEAPEAQGAAAGTGDASPAASGEHLQGASDARTGSPTAVPEQAPASAEPSAQAGSASQDEAGTHPVAEPDASRAPAASAEAEAGTEKDASAASPQALAETEPHAEERPDGARPGTAAEADGSSTDAAPSRQAAAPAAASSAPECPGPAAPEPA